MDTNSCTSRAIYYCVDDIPSANGVGGKLANMLTQLEETGALSGTLQMQLKRDGYHALQRLVNGEIPYNIFLPIAKEEQNARLAAKSSAEQKESLRVAASWREIEEKNKAELARRNNPARIRERELREKYGLSEFIPLENFPKLMSLVRCLDKGERISEEDYIWLKTTGGDYYNSYLTRELDVLYHELEALFFANEFKKTKDSWKAVSASKHFRKCKQAKQADELLGHIEFMRVKDAKVRSALFTTYGGVKRDLGEFDRAVKLGEQANALTPRDFRPCTLLGALHYEKGEYEVGQQWYDKAVERGFKKEDVDSELKAIFWHVKPDKRAKMREHLLTLDPVRYSWAREENRPVNKRTPQGTSRPKTGAPKGSR